MTNEELKTKRAEKAAYMRVYMQRPEQKAKAKLRKTQYYRENKEVFAEKGKLYNETNREEIRVRRHDSYLKRKAANPPRIGPKKLRSDKLPDAERIARRAAANKRWYEKRSIQQREQTITLKQSRRRESGVKKKKVFATKEEQRLNRNAGARARSARPHAKEAKQKYAAKYKRSEHGRELGSIHSNNRRLKKRNAEGSFTLAEWTQLKLDTGNICLCCKRPESERKLTKDHIVPVYLGGSNWITNIQPLCGPCNSSKGHRRNPNGTFIDYRPKL